MAGTTTVTEVSLGQIQKVTFECETDASGNGDQATTGVYSGKIVALATKGGTKQPADLWDLTITDSAGVDLLARQGVDRSNAQTFAYVVAQESLGYVAESTLTMNVSATGNTKDVVVVVFIA